MIACIGTFFEAGHTHSVHSPGLKQLSYINRPAIHNFDLPLSDSRNGWRSIHWIRGGYDECRDYSRDAEVHFLARPQPDAAAERLEASALDPSLDAARLPRGRWLALVHDRDSAAAVRRSGPVPGSRRGHGLGDAGDRPVPAAEAHHRPQAPV